MSTLAHRSFLSAVLFALAVMLTALGMSPSARPAARTAAAAPLVYAATWEGEVVHYGASESTAVGGVPVPGTYNLSAVVQNSGPDVLHDASITADASPPRPFGGNVSFPAFASTAMLLPSPDPSQGNLLYLRTLDGTSGGVGAPASVAPAADVTVESADVPVGGAAVTVTVTVTPRVASDSVGVWMSSFWPGTVADVEFPAVTDEQVWGSQHDTGFVSWTIGGAHLGHAYVLRVHVSAADAGVPYSFRPWVEVGSQSWSAAPDVTGTDYLIDVPDLGPGGSVAYHLAETVQWRGGRTHETREIFDAVAPPQVATVYTGVQRMRSMSIGDSESVSADPQRLTRYWSANAFNTSSSTVRQVAVGLDAADNVSFTPPLPTPIAEPPRDLEPGGGTNLTALAAHASAETASLGFGASRSLSTTTIPPGGGDVDVTVTMSPAEPVPNAAADILLVVSPNIWGNFPAATLVPGSVVWPTPAPGEDGYSQESDSNVSWSTSPATVGHDYTLRLRIHVANPSGRAITYRPGASANVSRWTATTPVVGTSSAVRDDVLGGTFTFSASDKVRWWTQISDSFTAYFRSDFPPAFSIEAVPTELTIAAGHSATVDMKAHVPPSVGGKLHIYIDRLPSGLSVVRGPDVGDGETSTQSIYVDASTKPGDYVVGFGAWSENAPGTFPVSVTVHVTASAPSAYAQVDRITTVWLDSGVDALDAGVLHDADLTWWTGLWPAWAPDGIPDASLSVDGSTLTFAPPLTFPIRAGSELLRDGDFLALDALGGAPSGSAAATGPVRSGFDAARTASPLRIPPGGGIQDGTVTVTLRDPALEGKWVWILVEASRDVAASVVPGSVIPPSKTDEALSWGTPRGARIAVSIGNAHVGVPYRLVYRLAVPNDASTSLLYKPRVWAEAGVVGEEIDTTARSIAVADEVLGGTFTFAAGIPVEWRHSVDHETDAIFASQAEHLPLVDHFAIEVVQPVHAAAAAAVTITALDREGNVADGYAGPVTLTDSTGSARFGDVTWLAGVGTTTVTFPSPADASVTATDGAGVATGVSRQFAVLGRLDHFGIDVAPATAPLATPLAVTVISYDAVGHVLAPDDAATIGDARSAATFTQLSGGVSTATFVRPVKDDRVTVADGAVTATSEPVTRVGPAVVFRIRVAPAGTIVAGTAAAVTVTAYDPAGNVATGYTGAPHVSDTAGIATIARASAHGGVLTTTATFARPVKIDVLYAVDGLRLGVSDPFAVVSHEKTH